LSLIAPGQNRFRRQDGRLVAAGCADALTIAPPVGDNLRVPEQEKGQVLALLGPLKQSIVQR
jgi:hypothetical protein